jgi:hypothetical protein
MLLYMEIDVQNPLVYVRKYVGEIRQPVHPLFVLETTAAATVLIN